MNALQRFSSVESMIRELRPETPVYCLDAAALRRNVRTFIDHFPGTTLYAVKCNPHPAVLEVIRQAGIDHFDVASIGEIQKVGRQFPEAHLFFMHPVKTLSAIRTAFRDYAVRNLVVDHPDELRKIALALGPGAEPARVRVFVRMKTQPDAGTSFVLSKKFGADAAAAESLLREVASIGFSAGIAFHVGSQCTTTAPYVDALREAHRVAGRSGVAISAVDVGGGFPADYPGANPPPLTDYFEVIGRGLEPFRRDFGQLDVYCEPGRAIVASAVAVVTQVHLRKGDQLYLNDGFYGSLCEAQQSAGSIKLNGHTLTADGPRSGEQQLFSLFGPTCDSCDSLGDAVHLDRDTAMGDWIVFSDMGAYSNALVTDFNGFQSNHFVAVGEDTEPAESQTDDGGYSNRRRAGS
jgi:ornithine decarboxylase